MRDHHDRLTVILHGLLHELEQLSPGSRIEVAGGFVGEDDFRATGECSGSRDALLLAAGQFGRLVGQAVAEREDVDYVVEPLRVRLAAGYVHRERDVLARVQRRHQIERLEHEAHLVAPEPRQGFVGQVREIDIAYEDLALRDPVESGHAVEKG